MSGKGEEIEVKFYLRNLPALQEKLLKLEARLVGERVHEVNLRFDTPDRALAQAGEMLRLRKDTEARVTFKGAGQEQAGARLRQELEFTVDDFDTTRQVFEALGFEVYMMYEKYRTTYELGEVLVTLDEMPFGEFAEIEGPDGKTIQRAARQLRLNWRRRSLDSYTYLFEKVKKAMRLTINDLSFANFEGVEIQEKALGLRTAN